MYGALHCCRAGRNITKVNPDITYFYYQKMYLQEQSIKKNEKMKTISLLPSRPVFLIWPILRIGQPTETLILIYFCEMHQIKVSQKQFIDLTTTSVHPPGGRRSAGEMRSARTDRNPCIILICPLIRILH